MLSDLEAVQAVFAKARCPEDVFGALHGDSVAAVHASLKKSYHQIVRVVHPDKYAAEPKAHKLATLLFKELTMVWLESAESKVSAKTYGDNAPHEVAKPKPTMSPQVIETPKGKYIVTELLAHGDIADLYRCSYTEAGVEKQAVFKIAQSAADNDLLDNEHKTLTAMYAQKQPEEKFYRYLPKPRDSFLLRQERTANRRVNVLQLANGYVSLVEVMQAFPSGLDFRDAVWMYKRGLEGLWYVHERKHVVHGAVLPEHVLVHPKRHGAKIVDWCYSVRDWNKTKDHVKAISKARRAYYAPEALVKEPVTPQTDIYMLTKCMVALLGGNVETNEMPGSVPKRFQQFLLSCLIEAQPMRPSDAGTLHQELDELLLRHLVGEPKFRVLEMPAKV